MKALTGVPRPAGHTPHGEHDHADAAPAHRRHGGALSAGLVVMLLLLLGVTVLSLAIGSGQVSAHDVLHGVLDPDLSVRGQLVVHQVRVPRTLAGLLAGTALGLAGAVMQGVTRNPLADPGLLGSTRAPVSPSSSPSACSP